VTAHARALCALSVLGAVSMLLVAAAGVKQLLHQTGHGQAVLGQPWLSVDAVASSSQGERQPGDNSAIYAALGTEDPWELGADDVEMHAFAVPASSRLGAE